MILYKGEVHYKDINDQRGVFEVKNHFKIHRSFILALRIQVYTVVVYTFWDLSLNLMKTLERASDVVILFILCAVVKRNAMILKTS